MLKIAIVGCGKIADGHVEQIHRMPELATVVAACDRERLMAEQLAFRYGIPRSYGDFDAMLAAEKPDVVHVATPPDSHVALAARAIEAGCHVYVEKPLALRHADAARLVQTAAAARKKLTVGYTYLYDPPALAMRELIAEGVLGDPVHVESVYGYDLDGAFGRALMSDRNHWVHKLPGKLVHNVLDHILNKIVEFMDTDEPDLSVLGKRLRPRQHGDERDDIVDELRVVLSGRRVTAYATMSSSSRPVVHRTRVCGTRNTLDVDYVSRTVTLDVAPSLPSAFGRLLPPFSRAATFAKEGGKNVLRFVRSDYHFFAGLHELLRRFYTSIMEDRPPPISDHDILWVSSVMDRVIDSLAQEKRA